MERKILNNSFLNMGRRKIKRSIYLLLVIALFIVFSGCHSLREPNDHTVLSLVKQFYLIYRGGENVYAEIIERENILKECDCYPIRFKITSSDRGSFKRVFYFYKNSKGNVDIREFKFGIKK